MTIEAEVAALTVATTDLLDAVNTGKANLDAAENAAELAAAQALASQNAAAASATTATTQATTATTQAGIATTQANNAVAVVTGGTASLLASPGKIPIADANAELDASWTTGIANNAYPTIRPTLDLDFINGATVDPRITFTRASTATYYDGKTFAKAEENLLLDSATLATQNVTTTAQPYTLSFEGTGTVTLSGTSTAGPLVGSTGRVSLTFTPTAGTLTLTVTGTVTNAQLEARSAATAYTPTTTQPITRYQPQLMTAPANTAVIDHDPVTGARLGLRVWEARTNLFTQSETFITSSKLGDAAVTNAVAVAPSGAVTASSLSMSTAGGGSLRFGNAILPIDVVHTFSVWIRGAAGTQVRLAVWDSGLGKINGPVITLTDTFTRYTFTHDPISTRGVQYAFIDPVSPEVNCIIWGAQLESGANASPYIPTTTAQVTRAADVASMTGANFSSWYRQDEGTLAAEFRTNTSTTAAFTECYATLTGPAIADRIEISKAGGQTALGYAVLTNNVMQANSSVAIPQHPSIMRTAAVFANNDFAASTNGGTVQTDTSGTVPAIDRLSIGQRGFGGNQANGHIRHITYYPARLSNATLQAITKP